MTDPISIPSLGEIHRTNLILVAAAGLLLLVLRSPAASLGCVVGGAVVIGNLFVLGLLGRLLTAAAAGGSGPWLGAVALPLKLILIALLVYLVFARTGIDGFGFGVGVSTQLIAILTETVRASIRSRGVA